ncbi:MAG: hypothetical protein R2795_24180 [Saprospiraceae bacterium]
MEQFVTSLYAVLGVSYACFKGVGLLRAGGFQLSSLFFWALIGIASLVLTSMNVIVYYADWSNPFYNLLSLLFYVLLVSIPPTFYLYLTGEERRFSTGEVMPSWVLHYLPMIVLTIVNITGFLIMVFADQASVFYQYTEEIVFFVNFTFITFFFLLQNLVYVTMALLQIKRVRVLKEEEAEQSIAWANGLLVGYVVFLMAVYVQQIYMKAYTGLVADAGFRFSRIPIVVILAAAR